MPRFFHIEIFCDVPQVNFLEEKYQDKWENAYLIVKNARAFKARRQALDPSQYYIAHLACLTSLRYVGKISEKNSAPPLDQILDPLLDFLT